MNVFVRRKADQYQWSVTSENNDQQHHHQGDLAALAAFYHENPALKNWVFIVPALDVASRHLSFSEKERRHIRKAIPFLLEDELLNDADELYFIHGKVQKNSVDVVAVDDAWFSEWLAQLQSAGIKPTHCIAEYQLLPEKTDNLQLFFQDDVFIVRSEGQQELAFEAQHLSLCLEILTAHYANLPATIELLAGSEEALTKAQQWIPDTLQHLVQGQVIDVLGSWQQQFAKNASVWNFLQGKYARSPEWLVLIKPWRFLAALILAACLLQVVLLYSDYREQKQRYEMLRSQMDTVFRKAFPQGQIVDHRRQLERLLTALRGGGSQQAFIVRLENIGAVLAKHKVNVLNALNYEQDKNEIRLDMLLDSYDQLQAVINDLRALNLEVEIQNSNAQGEQLRARVRIGG